MPNQPQLPSVAIRKKKQSNVTFEEIVETLGKNEFFGALDHDVRKLLAEIGNEHQYRRGETVLIEGERGDRMFVVVRGGVRVYRRSRSGMIIEIDRKHPGDIFGEIALLDDGPRSASIDTTCRTVLLSFERDIFIGLLEREPKTIAPLLNLLGRTLRRNMQLSADLVFLDLRSRLARCIIRLVEDANGNDLIFDRRVTQTELAQMVGAARQTVNGALRSLEEEDLITIDVDGIRVVNRDLLLSLHK